MPAGRQSSITGGCYVVPRCQRLELLLLDSWRDGEMETFLYSLCKMLGVGDRPLVGVIGQRGLVRWPDKMNPLEIVEKVK